MLSRLIGILSTNPPGEVKDPDCAELVAAYLRTFRELQTTACPISCYNLSCRLVRIVQIYNRFSDLIEEQEAQENYPQSTLTDCQFERLRESRVHVEEGRRIVRNYLLQIS